MARNTPPETREFRSILISPSWLFRFVKKTSASSLLLSQTNPQDTRFSVYQHTYIRRTASQDWASLNNLSRLLSAFSALVPISATPTEKSGFPVAIATVSAVRVFPTPGGPSPLNQSPGETSVEQLAALTIQEYDESLPLSWNDILHLSCFSPAIFDLFACVILHQGLYDVLIPLIECQLVVKGFV
jgi:hypothetical protein